MQGIAYIKANPAQKREEILDANISRPIRYILPSERYINSEEIAERLIEKQNLEHIRPFPAAATSLLALPFDKTLTLLNSIPSHVL